MEAAISVHTSVMAMPCLRQGSQSVFTTLVTFPLHNSHYFFLKSIRTNYHEIFENYQSVQSGREEGAKLVIFSSLVVRP